MGGQLSAYSHKRFIGYESKPHIKGLLFDTVLSADFVKQLKFYSLAFIQRLPKQFICQEQMHVRLMCTR